MQSNDDDLTTLSANKDTTVDADHDIDVDYTTHGHLPNRSCDHNSVTVLPMLTQVNQSQMEIRNCGVTVLEMMWMTI